jgi:hypothetical protein
VGAAVKTVARGGHRVWATQLMGWAQLASFHLFKSFSNLQTNSNLQNMQMTLLELQKFLNFAFWKINSKEPLYF